MSILKKLHSAAFALSIVAGPLLAQDSTDVEALFDSLQMEQITEIMQSEGIAYGRTIAGDMFPDRDGAEWAATVAGIYDIEMMQAKVRTDFETALGDADIAPLLAFFQTEQGRMFVELEVSARRAMLDDAVKTASEDAAAIAMKDRGPRFQLLAEFIESSDLVEPNVVGALNSNFAFYMGLMDGGAFDGALTQDQILTDVWAQEADIRANTTDWLYSFLLMAYAPMSDTDIHSYIAFSKSPSGEVLNRVLFSSYDEMFDQISYNLGQSAAKMMAAKEL